jgi:hypothetical protein
MEVRVVSVARLVLPLAVGASLAATAFCDDPAKPPEPDKSAVQAVAKASPEQVAGWLRDLRHADFLVREKATEALAKAGAAAVPGLTQVALEPKLESAIRAIKVLRKIYESGSTADFEAAADALEELALGKAGISTRADLALSSRLAERQQRVISRIEELGGEVRLGSRGTQAIFANGVLVQDDAPQVEQLLLGDDWKGGDASLKLLRRLPPSIRIALYVTPGCGIGQEALDALQADRPDIEIQHRGSAMLGISCDTQDGELTVMRVQEGSGAAQSGLVEKDVIRKFEGKEIHEFPVIIETIRDRKVGDKVTLEVDHEGTITSKVVTLGKWTLKDLKR